MSLQLSAPKLLGSAFEQDFEDGKTACYGIWHLTKITMRGSIHLMWLSHPEFEHISAILGMSSFGDLVSEGYAHHAATLYVSV